MNIRLRVQGAARNRVGLPLLAALGIGLLYPAAAQGPVPQQPYLIDVWQTENGLPENIVNAIAQTRDGYLWCGTTHGLARFDGVNFKVFNGENTPELGSGRIRQLFVDRSGALWITIFEGGLIRYQNGLFTAFALPPREKTTARTIFWIAEDESGVLWLTVEDGAVFRFAKGAFTPASKDWPATERNIFRVYGDAQGRAWVATSTYLARLDRGKILPPVLEGKLWEYQFLCPSRSGGWWIQTHGRVRLWRDGQWLADGGKWVRPDRVVECCLEDGHGQLWVASLGKGVFCYSTNAPEPRQITVKEGLGSDLVRALFEDSEGNLWAGTRPGGLNRLRPALFRTYGRKEGLSSDLVTAICEGADGELWVGTDGEGVNRLKDNVVQQFGAEQGLDSRNVRALLMDREKNLWEGSWAGGLYQFKTNRFIPRRDIPGRDTPVASLFEDAEGRLWVGQRTLNQLVRLENSIVTTVSLPNPAPAMDVIALTQDVAGNIWIGTDGSGLFRWHDGQCRRFTRRDGLSSDTVRALHAEADGALWIGTVDGGLCRLKDNHFVTCTTRNGLADDVINHIADDGRGFFWLSSFQGIFRVSKAELNQFADGTRRRIECLTFGKSDGLPALECPGGFQPAGCRTSDGRLWFPTIKGLVVVDPANVPTNAIVSPVLIESILVDGEAQHLPAGADEPRSELARHPGDLIIQPGRHRYEFRYTGLNFSAPERVRFRHKLDGLEEEWVEAGTQRAANYNHLSPGVYRFRVTACNQAGVWNSTGATLAFRVLPHFWQTWWFILGGASFAALALGATVAFMSRRKLKRRLQRLELQLSVEKERARIAQDIHDGVGANLTEIAWLAEVAEHDAGNPGEVRAQARKISGTARETVQSFDEIVWAVLPQNDTLTSLVEYLGRRVDEMFDNTATRCWFSAPPELPNTVVPAEVRHSFYLACKEALHNVNKHAAATEVRVKVAVEDGTLRVSIEDNGCGFDPSASRSEGNGLRNMRQRFQDLGGRFALDSRPGQGTRVSMAIPLTPPRRA
jgi:ligand-binding sensor domain-containing protein/signal transduction histidine kinase